MSEKLAIISLSPGLGLVYQEKLPRNSGMNMGLTADVNLTIRLHTSRIFDLTLSLRKPCRSRSKEFRACFCLLRAPNNFGSKLESPWFSQNGILFLGCKFGMLLFWSISDSGAKRRNVLCA
jgi:hypothetical protein